MLAYDYIDYLYNDETNFCSSILHGINPDVAPDWIKMEIWLSDELPVFNEEKFNNLITHYERTGEKVPYV